MLKVLSMEKGEREFGVVWVCLGFFFGGFGFQVVLVFCFVLVFASP